MRLNNLIFAALVVIFTTFSVPVFADEPDSAETSEKFARISQYCETIKSNFKRLAVSDSKTRTYYGGIYETISSKYITPLNLRLIKNNYSLSEFVELQSSFINAREKFSSDFISYSKSLEELSVFDCKNNPSDFYEKLNKTREKRAVLKTDIETLNSLLKTHVSLVKDLKGSLNGTKN